MLKSSGAMGAATLASRVLGMAREILYAWFMGAGPVAGAFKMAFIIPNLFRRLLGEGALTAAFIPIFKEKEKTTGEGAMWESANAVISGLAVTAGILIGLVILGISILLAVDGAPMAPGEIEMASPSMFTRGWLDPETRLMLELLRVMFPYLLLVCVAAIFMGMLNARGYFFAPAMGAVVLNGVLIVTVVLVAPQFGVTKETQIFGLAFGVLAAGFAQAVYQYPILHREGFRLRWVSPWRHESVRLVVRRMIPGMMGVAAFQLNVLLTMGIATSVDVGMVAGFDYAVRLMELPQGVFGISLATYLLPTLAGLASEKKYPEFRQTLGQAIGYLCFANLIASILLMVLAEPIMRLLFERGEFSPGNTRDSSFALACLAPGLVAFSLVNILARAFYALGDTQTPMKVSSFCLVINVVFVALLISSLREGGLGVANTMSAALNVALLLYALKRKLKFLNLGGLRRDLLTMVGAAILGGQVAWMSSRAWEKSIGHGDFAEKLGAVFVPMALACVVYGGVLLWMRVPQALEFAHLMRARFGGKGRSE